MAARPALLPRRPDQEALPTEKDSCAGRPAKPCAPKRSMVGIQVLVSGESEFMIHLSDVSQVGPNRREVSRFRCTLSRKGRTPGRMVTAGMRRSLRVALLYAVVVVLIAVLAEVGGWVTAHLLADRGILYVPEEVEDYPRYLAERDPVLGWPRPSDFGKGDYDEAGSRIIPAFSHTRKACISLYGDSFTWERG